MNDRSYPHRRTGERWTRREFLRRAGLATLAGMARAVSDG